MTLHRLISGWVASAVVLAALSIGIQPARAQSVLFIGNSFTFADHGALAQPAGGVPALFERIAKLNRHAPETRMVTIPGSTLKQHADNQAGEMDAIQSRHWDYVVLQGYSQEATQAYGKQADFLKYGLVLAQAATKNSPATKVLLYQSWAYPTWRDVYPKRYVNPAEMLREIDAGYKALSNETGGAIVPVGDAFAAAMAAYPQYNLYTPGDYHASDNGYYLSAVCFYTAVYGQPPKVTTPVIADITPDEASRFAAVAAQVQPNASH